MPPERYKPREAWTVDEILRHARTGRKPENPEYTEARNEHLVAGGFEAEEPEPVESYEGLDPEQIEGLSIEDHERLIRRNR